jgi:hypothetical protein
VQYLQENDTSCEATTLPGEFESCGQWSLASLHAEDRVSTISKFFSGLLSTVKVDIGDSHCRNLRNITLRNGLSYSTAGPNHNRYFVFQDSCIAKFIV